MSPPVAAPGLFGALQPQPPDALLSLIGPHRSEARLHKIDLGIGVYRDLEGATPAFRSVKAAEAHLLAEQSTEAYLGPEGDLGYLERLMPIIFGRDGQAGVFGPARLDLAASNIKALARANWSTPPDHGAAVVKVILESSQLTQDWKDELEGMRRRIVAVRQALAAAPALKGLVHQHGIFAQLPLSPRQVARMRERPAVYMAGSGRINLAGLTPSTVSTFAQAYTACLQEEFA